MKSVFVKKTMFLNKNNINKALRILNAKTEKDAVNKALEIVVEEADIISAHKEVGGSGELEKVYK